MGSSSGSAYGARKRTARCARSASSAEPGAVTGGVGRDRVVAWRDRRRRSRRRRCRTAPTRSESSTPRRLGRRSSGGGASGLVAVMPRNVARGGPYFPYVASAWPSLVGSSPPAGLRLPSPFLAGRFVLVELHVLRERQPRLRPAVLRIDEDEFGADDGRLSDGDGQSEPVALAAALGTEPLRTAGQQVVREARAVIAYGHHRPVDRQDHRRAAVLVCVGDQIAEDPFQPPPVRLDPHVPRSAAGFRSHDADLGLRPRRAHHPFGERRQFVHGEIDLLGTGVEAGDLQQILRQRPHGADPVPHQLGRPAGRQQLGGGRETGQRGAQLVRHIGGEALFCQQFALERGRHRVQRAGDDRHLVLRARRVRRTGVVDAGVEIARADPAGHPGGLVQPPGDPADGERADQQRRRRSPAGRSRRSPGRGGRWCGRSCCSRSRWRARGRRPGPLPTSPPGRGRRPRRCPGARSRPGRAGRRADRPGRYRNPAGAPRPPRTTWSRPPAGRAPCRGPR